MKPELVDLIVCPTCGDRFELTAERWYDGEVDRGSLACARGHRYPIKDSIPRFIDEDLYADAFALEWNAFRTAHLDSFTGLTYLKDQFSENLDFPIDRLEGKLVLDAGCGLGRFSEVVLDHGARVVAVDLSRAIDAAFANLKARSDVYFIQADIFSLPFRPETFDFVYSWGVLHHTPDPPAAFRALPPLVRPGGKLMTFVYAKYNKAYLATTEFYRRLTRRLPKRLLLKLSYLAVPLYYLGRVPVVGPFITRVLLPVSVHPPTHRWRVGNTFDLYSPEYAFTYDHVDVHGWYERAGMEQIRPVAPGGGVCYIATKPPLHEGWDDAVPVLPESASATRMGVAANGDAAVEER
ncbi:MAG: methyltransferase domain-containing protein [Actinobacteria bacterium]|nr:methyltransferase domain-containing protein [Actinomycetota bacterium]